jgi:hypothetical protein
LRERQEELATRNAVVVVIGFEAARRMRGYCGNLKLGEWPCLVDEDLTVYHAYGLQRLPWWRTLHLASLRGYITFWRQGQAMPSPRADIRQAGGDFVVDPAGWLVLIHPGRSPHDRPSVDQILGVIGT